MNVAELYQSIDECKACRLLKKTHMLRCAQSPRVNVLPMYASSLS